MDSFACYHQRCNFVLAESYMFGECRNFPAGFDFIVSLRMLFFCNCCSCLLSSPETVKLMIARV